MRAVRIHAYGDARVLTHEDVPIPAVGPGEMLVKVRAAGVNPLDWKVREGLLRGVFAHALPLVLGWDVAGTVERTGALVTRFKPGDAVFAHTDPARDGAYAEYLALHEDEAAPAPASVALEQAAAVPTAALAAWQALFVKGHLQPGQKVLIHAAAGGVGSFAVQLAKLAGARVAGTASAVNGALIRALGADDFIDYVAEDVAARLHDVDLVVDTVGGATQAHSFAVLKPGGRLVSTLSAPSADLAAAHGVHVATLALAPDGARLDTIGRLLDAGRLKVVIDKFFMLTDVADAHARSESGRTRGKIVLRI